VVLGAAALILLASLIVSILERWDYHRRLLHRGSVNSEPFSLRDGSAVELNALSRVEFHLQLISVT